MCYISRTVIQERQFESICGRLLNAKRHMINIKNTLTALKNDKPKMVINDLDSLTVFQLCQKYDIVDSKFASNSWNIWSFHFIWNFLIEDDFLHMYVFDNKI